MVGHLVMMCSAKAKENFSYSLCSKVGGRPKREKEKAAKNYHENPI